MKIIKEWSGVIALLAIIFTWIVPSPSTGVFGATGTRMPNGLSTNSTSPVANELRTTTLTVDSTSVFTGGITNSSTVTNNGAVTNNSSVIYSSATSSSAIPSTYTVVQADLLTNNTIIAGLAAASTWTLPATSTLTSMIPAAGDSQTFCVLAYYNSLTFVAGTGMDFEVASTTDDVFGVPSKVIPAGNRGCLTFTRATTTDVNVGFVRFINGD